MIQPTAEGLDRLPQSMRGEIDRIVAALPPTASCVVSGSLVEGLGNPNSDLDLYAISEDRSAGRSTTIGIRQGNYVDCEHVKLTAVEQLCERVDAGGWAEAETVGLKDIDRYYRLAIAVPVRVTPAAARVLGSLRIASAAEALIRHAGLRAYEHLALAACLTATGQAREADLILREASLWWATGRLAAAGEGYASLKWVGEKAARRYGRGSTEFRELVDGYLRPAGSLDERVGALRAAVAAPAALTAVLEARTAGLAERVQFLEAGEHAYLMKPAESIVRLDGVVVPVCRVLAAGASWREATDQVAGSLGLAPAEFRAAAWRESGHLRAHSLLV